MLENISQTMKTLVSFQLLQNPNVRDWNCFVADLCHVGGVAIVQHGEWNAFNSHADPEAEERFQFTLERFLNVKI